MQLALTRRQSQVIERLIRGLENKQIAAELGLAEQTVKKHVSALLRKFDVPNRAALADAAATWSLVGTPHIDARWLSQLFRDAEPQVCVLAGPDLRYVIVNRAFEHAVGDRELIGRTMREAFPELEGQGIFERVERVYATGEVDIQHGRVARWDRGRGIEARVVDLVLQPLRDDRGQVNGVVSFAVDVTDVIESEGRLRAEVA